METLQKIRAKILLYKQHFAPHKTLIISSLVAVLVVLVSAILFVSFREEASQPQAGEEFVGEGSRIENRDTGSAAFAPVSCPESKPHNKAYWSGKLIDSHFHLPTTGHRPFDTVTGKFLTEEGELGDHARTPILGIHTTITEIACLFAYEGTESAFSFFRIDTEREEKWMGIERKNVQLEVVKKAVALFPNRFIMFINMPDEPSGFQTIDADELTRTLALAESGLFRGYGEVGLYPSEGVPSLSPDSERLRKIYPVLREHGLVVYFHLGEGQKDSFRRVLRDNSDINFIFHGDQLRGDTDSTGRIDLHQIEEILKNHKNVFYTVDNLYAGECILCADEGRTKEQLVAHLKNYEPLIEKDLAGWKEIIEKYPNQLIWGTDRGGPWTFDREVGWILNDYARAFIARLDPAVQEKFAYKNVERLLQNR